MDYSKLKVNELKEECTKRGLPTSGIKAILIARLMENDDQGTTTKTDAIVEEPKQTKTETTDSKKRKVEDVSKEESAPKKLKKANVDEFYGGSGEVYADETGVYACMLNQTNIAQNNNKFYVIQLIKNGNTFTCFTRWGRVGEPGQQQEKSCTKAADGIKEFEKKFKDKSGNAWSARDNFVEKSGKYLMVDMADADEEDEPIKEIVKSTKKERGVRESKLQPAVQELIKLIFDDGMFGETLKEFELDVEKMPLGKISKNQIKRGLEVLEELKSELEGKKNKSTLATLSSKFYSVIPHSFGRKVPPVIQSAEVLQSKIDMLNVLADIEVAQQMKEATTKIQDEEENQNDVENPMDIQYDQLGNKIVPVDKNSEEFKVITKYIQASSPGLKLRHLYTIDRSGEKERFSEHKDLKNRKLLWHGTNVAVVSCILKTGLRIMPNAGGRVGRGLYFASENSKSAGYVGCSYQNFTGSPIGMMFLNEVALGKEHHITEDDSSLRCAPKGYESVVAQGRTEPSEETKFGDVVVPYGKPVARPEYKSSMFTQTEYLVYKESQVNMKYLCMIDFSKRGY